MHTDATRPAVSPRRLDKTIDLRWLRELARRVGGFGARHRTVTEPVPDTVAWDDTEIDIRRVVL